MPDTALVELYATGLAEGFIHPNGTPYTISNHRDSPMPPEMAAEVKKQRTAMAEAMVNHAETHGYAFVPTAEPGTLRTTAARADGQTPPAVELWCNEPGCGRDKPLLTLSITGEKAQVDARRLLSGLASLNTNCPTRCCMMPNLPLPEDIRAGIDNTQPLRCDQAGAMVMTYANILDRLFGDPRAELIDYDLEQLGDGRIGFTFRCELRKPEVQPDAIKAIGS